jgi:hypothetical protein
MGVELRNKLQQILGINIPFARFLEGISIEDLTREVLMSYEQANLETQNLYHQTAPVQGSLLQSALEVVIECTEGEEVWVTTTI